MWWDRNANVNFVLMFIIEDLSTQLLLHCGTYTWQFNNILYFSDYISERNNSEKKKHVLPKYFSEYSHHPGKVESIV